MIYVKTRMLNDIKIGVGLLKTFQGSTEKKFKNIKTVKISPW